MSMITWETKLCDLRLSFRAYSLFQAYATSSSKITGLELDELPLRKIVKLIDFKDFRRFRGVGVGIIGEFERLVQDAKFNVGIDKSESINKKYATSINALEQVPAGLAYLISKVEYIENMLTNIEDMLLSIMANPHQPNITEPTGEEYLTRTQVKDKLKISYPTLKAWTNEGKINGYRIGSRVRYKASEIDQALQAIK